MSSEAAIDLEGSTVIRCDRLGKCYKIYENPKDRLKQALWRGRRQFFQEFWALRDVSLEVKSGESLGIIGRNGSGKSTLLQLICGTLTPTEGRIQSNGRIAALLELGSGFNPEFTGLENVYLNASMLGLSKAETESRLDDILSFADIGEFIHQPVKAYSSGMAVRLAFAVATNVSADMLIVDEALSVGDHPFQQKCFTNLRRFQEEGGTTILVSHENASIKRLCDRAIWLSGGLIRENDQASLVVDKYRDWCDKIHRVDYNRDPLTESIHHDFSLPNPGSDSQDILYEDKDISVSSHGLLSEGEVATSRIVQLANYKLRFTITNSGLSTGAKLRLGFWIRDQKSFEVCGSNTMRDLPLLKIPDQGDTQSIEFFFPMPPLRPGYYTIRFNVDITRLSDDATEEWTTVALVDNCLPFFIDESPKLEELPYGLIGLPCQAYLGED